MGTVLPAGETPVCLLAATGTGCTIQNAPAITQDNFCTGDSATAATAATTASDSSSNEAGGTSGNEASAEYDYEDYGGFDSTDAGDYPDDGPDQQDAYEESDNGGYSRDDDSNDDVSDADTPISSDETEQVDDSSTLVCNRLQDFQSLVGVAAFEYQKEQIEGHIRSNSLVFNTFIFLQVSSAHRRTVTLSSILYQLSILVTNNLSAAARNV